jgi:hypothetical protein
MSTPKLPQDFPGLDLAAWNEALPMPESRPLALRRNAQLVLDAVLERELKPPTLSPFQARGLRRSRP